MFVKPSARRRGIARQILRRLEEEIRHRGFRSIVLETGCANSEAIAMYEADGYFPIPAFLGYVRSPISLCYAKKPRTCQPRYRGKRVATLIGGMALVESAPSIRS